MTEQQIDLRERELDYWMTRAYEAEGKLWKAEARIKAVRELHREVIVYELDSMNGTWVYGEDDERVVLRRYCAECSSEDVIHAVEDQDWMEDWGYAWEVNYPCPTIRALDG